MTSTHTMRRGGGVGRTPNINDDDPRSTNFSLSGTKNAPSRRCPICRVVKPAAAFVRDASKASGYASRCLECDAKRSRQYYAVNRDAKLEASRRKHGQGQPRVCRRCNSAPTITPRHWYCPTCKSIVAAQQRKVRGRSRSQGTSTARGYGTNHQKLREKWARKVAAGGVVCARVGCGRLILSGEPWHLGHVDQDRSRYAGPEHEKCNCATAGRPNHRRARARRKIRG
jgi:hypothetical protein